MTTRKPNQVTRAGWSAYYRELHARTGRASARVLCEWYAALAFRFAERRQPAEHRLPLGAP